MTQAGAPVISGIGITGKNLIVSGSNYVEGARIVMDGTPQKTIFQDSSTLIGKKVGKQIASGQTVSLAVRNPDGFVSQASSFRRP